MQKNLCKKFVAFVLVLVLAVSVTSIAQNPVEVQAATKTVKKNGYTYNKLPYKSNKLTISKLTFGDNYGVAEVKNETGNAIGNLSRFPYTCYNKAGEVLKTSDMYIQMCNKGESCLCTFSYPTDTVKVIFGDAVIRTSDSYKKSAKTKNYNGVKITKLPKAFSKVKFTKATVTDTKNGKELTLTYKNQAGKPMSDLSSLLLKCYNKSGQVVNSGVLYLNQVNDGDTDTVDLSLGSDVTEVHLLGVTFREGDPVIKVKTHKVDGIEVNVTPYTRDGLTIESIDFDRSKATIKVTNNTGKNLDHLSSFNFQSFDEDGALIDSGSFFLQDMNAGDTCISTQIVGKIGGDSPAKLVFDTTNLRELDKKIPSVSKYDTIGDLKVNKMPYSENGLKFEFLSFDRNTYYYSLTNNSGKSIGSPSINYRVLNEDGNVIESSIVYGKMLDDGEKCLGYFHSSDDWAKIELYGCDYREGTKFGDIKTAKVDDIITNKVPYTNDKLKITDISFEKGYSSYSATIVLQNNTGYDLRADDYVSYKCYDENGYVIDSGSKYTPDIKKGESASISLSYLDGKSVKVLFYVDVD